VVPFSCAAVKQERITDREEWATRPANPATDQKLATVGGFAHIHPKGGGDRGFVQGPSGEDKKFAGMSTGPINLVVGAADKKVYFYNGSGVIGKPMKLKDFMGNP